MNLWLDHRLERGSLRDHDLGRYSKFYLSDMNKSKTIRNILYIIGGLALCAIVSGIETLIFEGLEYTIDNIGNIFGGFVFSVILLFSTAIILLGLDYLKKQRVLRTSQDDSDDWHFLQSLVLKLGVKKERATTCVGLGAVVLYGLIMFGITKIFIIPMTLPPPKIGFVLLFMLFAFGLFFFLVDFLTDYVISKMFPE